MKKLYLLAVFTLLCLTTNAQKYFELTPDGFKTSNNKEFIVVYIPNMSPSAIYNMLETGLISVFPPAHSTLNKETDTRFSITSVARDLFRINAGIGMQYIMDMEFNVVIDIKEGKYRIVAPTISHLGMLANYRISRMVVYGDPKVYKNYRKNQFIFNFKDRTIQNNEAKIVIENYINNVVQKIVHISRANEDW